VAGPDIESSSMELFVKGIGYVWLWNTPWWVTAQWSCHCNPKPLHSYEGVRASWDQGEESSKPLWGKLDYWGAGLAFPCVLPTPASLLLRFLSDDTHQPGLPWATRSVPSPYHMLFISIHPPHHCLMNILGQSQLSVWSYTPAIPSHHVLLQPWHAWSSCSIPRTPAQEEFILGTLSWEPPQFWGLYSPTLHFSISINSPTLHF
jgi:hypothetical protein